MSGNVIVGVVLEILGILGSLVGFAHCDTRFSLGADMELTVTHASHWVLTWSSL